MSRGRSIEKREQGGASPLFRLKECRPTGTSPGEFDLVAGNDFGETNAQRVDITGPNIEVHSRTLNVQVAEDADLLSSEQRDAILALLANGTTPPPELFHTADADYTPHTRSASFLLPDPNSPIPWYVRVGGIGLGMQGLNGIGYELPNPRNETVRQMRKDMGLTEMGTVYVTATGRPDMVTNEEPQGAYTREDVEAKVRNTIDARRPDRGIPAELPEILMWGTLDAPPFRHPQTNRDHELGWLAYRYKPTMNITELFALSNAIDVERGMRSYLFETWLYDLGKTMRAMHDSGLVHFQMHGGNIGMTFDGKVFVGDWETSRDISGYSNRLCDPQFSPRQRAIHQELTIVSDSLVEMYRHENVQESECIPRLSEHVTWLLEGYTEGGIQNPNLRRIEQKLPGNRKKAEMQHRLLLAHLGNKGSLLSQSGLRLRLKDLYSTTVMPLFVDATRKVYPAQIR